MKNKDISELLDEITVLFIKGKEEQRKRWSLQEQRIKLNLKHLDNKRKELNKEVPFEVIAAVYSGRPQGSWFFEKFKEWL